MRLERGTLVADADGEGYSIGRRDSVEVVTFDADELRWLASTALPALAAIPSDPPEKVPEKTPDGQVDGQVTIDEVLAET